MWLQKKNVCPICRKDIDKIISLYFPIIQNHKNTKLNTLFFTIENVKIDNFGHISKKCLICGKEEPQEQLIICDCCNYFQTHLLCDPPIGLSYGKYYCPFCRRKFIESLRKK